MEKIPFGFHVRKNEPTIENDSGSEGEDKTIYLDKDHDPFRAHAGKPVQYHSKDGPVFGIYLGSDTDGQLYFQPSVTSIPTVRSNNLVQKLTWETERPTIIPYDRNCAMRPVTLSSLRKMTGIDIIDPTSEKSDQPSNC